MKKEVLIGLLVCMLAVCFVVIGCDTTTGGETDTWTDVTSLEQLDGTWKGSYRQTMAIKEAIEESGLTWDPGMQTLVGNMIATVRVDMDITINASDKTQTGSALINMTLSGGNINMVWPLIKIELSGQEGVTINDSTHTISMTLDTGTNPIDISDMAGAQINQHGTKLKVPADALGTGSPEIIFTKQ
jgi:hypothetical protein